MNSKQILDVSSFKFFITVRDYSRADNIESASLQICTDEKDVVGCITRDGTPGVSFTSDISKFFLSIKDEDDRAYLVKKIVTAFNKISIDSML